MRVQYYIKRIIILICAIGWIFNGMFAAESQGSISQNIQYIVPGAIILITALIAWKWEKTGGILLAIQGLFVLIVYPWLAYGFFPFSRIIFVTATLALPLLIVGIWFIIGSRREDDYLR